MLADPKSARARRQLRRPVAVPAQRARASKPDPIAVSRVRREPPRGVPRETELFVREPGARGPQRARRADVGLHVRQRAAGRPLRDSGRLRQPLPARDGCPTETRRGILGHGSVLTATSYANRTSPVLRGEVGPREPARGAAAAAAPDVPGLEDSDSVADPSDPDGRAPLGARADGAAPYVNPVCASCHVPMDPLGFALENFDAVGRWRALPRAAGADQTSGTSCRDGTRAFDGAGRRARDAARQPRGVRRTVTEKLLTYALGRGVEYYDRPVDPAPSCAGAEPNGYRWSSLILGIVESTPFQMREAREQ